MKISNAIINAALEAMNQPEFVNETKGQTGYALYRNIRILSNEIQDYQKLLRSAIEKYGKENEDGSYSVDPSDHDNFLKFTEEMTPIAALEVDVDVYQIDGKDFELPYCKTATPAQYSLIEELIVKKE